MIYSVNMKLCFRIHQDHLDGTKHLNNKLKLWFINTTMLTTTNDPCQLNDFALRKCDTIESIALSFWQSMWSRNFAIFHRCLKRTKKKKRNHSKGKTRIEKLKYFDGLLNVPRQIMARIENWNDISTYQHFTNYAKLASARKSCRIIGFVFGYDWKSSLHFEYVQITKLRYFLNMRNEDIEKPRQKCRNLQIHKINNHLKGSGPLEKWCLVFFFVSCSSDCQSVFGTE